jgi:hypothetical protein
VPLDERDSPWARVVRDVLFRLRLRALFVQLDRVRVFVRVVFRPQVELPRVDVVRVFEVAFAERFAMYAFRNDVISISIVRFPFCGVHQQQAT